MIEFLFFLSLVILVGVNIAIRNWRSPSKFFWLLVTLVFLVNSTLFLFTELHNQKNILIFFSLLFLALGVGVYFCHHLHK